MGRKDFRVSVLVLLTSMAAGVASAADDSPKECPAGGSALALLDCHNAKRAATAQSTEEYRIILDKLRWVRQTSLASLEMLARVRQLIDNHECTDLHQAIEMIKRGDAALAEEDQKALIDLKGVLDKDYASRKCAAKLSERATF